MITFRTGDVVEINNVPGKVVRTKSRQLIVEPLPKYTYANGVMQFDEEDIEQAGKFLEITFMRLHTEITNLISLVELALRADVQYKQHYIYLLAQAIGVEMGGIDRGEIPHYEEEEDNGEDS